MKSVSMTQKHALMVSRNKPKAITIADLSADEKAKVSRLVERLVTLGNENEEIAKKITEDKAIYEDEVTKHKAKVEMATGLLHMYQNKMVALLDQLKVTTNAKVELERNYKQLDIVSTNQRKNIEAMELNRTKHQEVLKSKIQALEKYEQENKYLQNDIKQRIEREAQQQLKTKKLEELCATLTKQVADEHSLVQEKDLRCVELENRLFSTLSQQIQSFHPISESKVENIPPVAPEEKIDTGKTHTSRNSAPNAAQSNIPPRNSLLLAKAQKKSLSQSRSWDFSSTGASTPERSSVASSIQQVAEVQTKFRRGPLISPKSKVVSSRDITATVVRTVERVKSSHGNTNNETSQKGGREIDIKNNHKIPITNQRINQTALRISNLMDKRSSKKHNKPDAVSKKSVTRSAKSAPTARRPKSHLAVDIGVKQMYDDALFRVIDEIGDR